MAVADFPFPSTQVGVGEAAERRYQRTLKVDGKSLDRLPGEPIYLSDRTPFAVFADGSLVIVGNNRVAGNRAKPGAASPRPIPIAPAPGRRKIRMED